MPSKTIVVHNDVPLVRLADGGYSNSVSVATPDALVVIENLRYIDSDTMMADVVVVEDDPDA